MTIREMAAELGVGRRRSGATWSCFALAFPLEETVNAFGRKTYGMRNAADTPPLSFCLDEALALYLSRRFLEPLAGTLFWDAAQSAFRKIRASLGDRALAYVETMACFFHTTKVGVSDYGPKAKLLDALTQAIEDSRAVHLLYQSEQATEPASRDVYPYTFAYHHGSIYLIAHDPNAGKIKHYKLDRVEDVEVSPFPFRRPPDFDVRQHLLPSFGVYLTDGPLRTIKVRFAPAVARYVQESEWHDRQTVTKQRDGSLLAEIQLVSDEKQK